jgi:hypothetical protein
MTPLLAGALAVPVQFLPDVIDFTVIPDMAGTVGLLCALLGATRGLGPDRLGRVTLLGNLIGALIAVSIILSNLARQVL